MNAFATIACVCVGWMIVLIVCVCVEITFEELVIWTFSEGEHNLTLSLNRGT